MKSTLLDHLSISCFLFVIKTRLVRPRMHYVLVLYPYLSSTPCYRLHANVNFHVVIYPVYEKESPERYLSTIAKTYTPCVTLLVGRKLSSFISIAIKRLIH